MRSIEPQVIEQEGALWSPARIEDSEIGPQLFLSTTSVGADNVDDERLWGNVEAAMPRPRASSRGGHSPEPSELVRVGRLATTGRPVVPRLAG